MIRRHLRGMDERQRAIWYSEHPYWIVVWLGELALVASLSGLVGVAFGWTVAGWLGL